MTLPYLPRDSEGKTTIPFSMATLSRASGAFSPDTGAAYRNNVPRLVSDRIPKFSWTPRTFYDFESTETEMLYDTTTNNLVDRQIAFHAAFPEFVTVNLGTSFGSRDMLAYRLGPPTRKHFIVTCVMHGNEHDGLNGAFKAMEILSRTPDFQAFLAEWTLFFVPCMNPDGYKLNTRNLENIGPNGNTVNLNRNFDWFWNEYTEDPTESKGSAAASEIEAQNLLDYLTTGNYGNPVPVGFFMDLHSNEFVGRRFQARERVWKNITNGPGNPGTGLPYGYLAQYADSYVWKVHQIMETLRVYLDTTPREMYTSYRRTKYLPQLHSYLSSLGWVSMVVEELSVAAAGGRETFQTACNFRLDYILAAAAVATASNWTWSDACLVEKSATNILTNAQFQAWSDLETRPSYYSLTRATPTKDTTDTLLDGAVASVKVESDLTTTLPQGEEYPASCPAGVESVAVLEPSVGKVFYIPNQISSAAEVITLALHTTNYQAALVYSGVGQVDVIGGGTAPGAGASNLVHRVSNLSGTPAEAAVGNIGTARQGMGYCDNFLSSPIAADIRGYIAGGIDGAGTLLATIGTWTPTTATYAASAQSLATPCQGLCCVYYPEAETVYLFGGIDAGGMLARIQVWDPVADTLATVATAVLPTAKAWLSGWYSQADGKIYLTGGQDGAGNMTSAVDQFDPVAGTISTVTVYANLDDNEDREYSGRALWATKLGRSTAVVFQDDTGASQLYLIGGRLNSTAGTLSDVLYSYDSVTATMSQLDVAGYGYLKHTLPLNDTQYTDFYTDNFALGIGGWSNPSGAWSAAGGKAVGVSGTVGWLVSGTDPTRVNERIIVSVEGSLPVGAAPTFSIAARATFAGANLTNGYRVSCTNDGATQIWILYRVVGGVVVVLITVDVTANPTQQITNVARVAQLSVEDTAPVHIVLQFNGSTLIDYYDCSALRISTVGKMGVYGGGL
jgi:hypothetical protein